MIFSVYDHNSRCFNYFEAPGTGATYGVQGTKYRQLSQQPLSGLGFAPEALVPPLPVSARPIGRGTVARGIMARMGGSEGLGDYTPPTLIAPVLGGLGEAPAVCPPCDDGPKFMDMVAAASIAAVVGVVVQRAMKKGR